MAGSVRRKLTENVNDSKNTRMNIAKSGDEGDWRVDVLAHISRYNRIAYMAIRESAKLARPLDCLEIGCGEFWPLKALYKAYQVPKDRVVRSYFGVDIDPAVLTAYAALPGNMNLVFTMNVMIQDLTVQPALALQPGSVDFFWSTEVIEHMQPRFVPAWLDEVNRTLRPGALIYVSTPNSDGSHEKLPEDHVYEWGFDELKGELTKRWTFVEATGTFIQLPIFDKINKMLGRVPQDLVDDFRRRFDTHWLRNVLAAPYPEQSNNVAWTLRKPIKRTAVRE